jgi:hypothetical protein
MRPALRIFRKDVRHLWPRIAVVLAAELLLGCISFWPPPGLAGTRSLLGVFEILAWWYLIAAVIHEEAAPGNRQYWLTRPFSRRDLLAAKVIFILVFLCLPVFLGEVASLVLRGKSPVAYLPEMLVSQLFFLAKVVLPATALASITASLVEFGWTSLAAVVGLYIILVPLMLRAQSVVDWGGLEWFRATVVAALALTASVAILLVQYVRRWTWLSRGMVVAALLIGVSLIWMPGWHTAFALQTRLSGQHVADTVAHIAFAPARDRSNRPVYESRKRNVDAVPIPVRVTGIPDGMALYIERVNATVDTPNRGRWSSGWDSLADLYRVLRTQGAGMEEERFLLGDGEYWLYLNIDRSIYESTGSGPMHLHARMALTLLSAEQITPLTLRGGAQAVPNDGFCWVTSRKRQFETACSWPVRTPARFHFRQRPGGTSLGWWNAVGSYGPYSTSGELWQWVVQTGGMDPQPVGIDLVTRGAVAHFERDLDIPAVGEWPK